MNTFAYRNIRIDERMSQETLAFTGDITRDGLTVGTVRNDGTGGADFWFFPAREDQVAFEEAAMASFPDAGGRFAAQEELSYELLVTAVEQVLEPV